MTNLIWTFINIILLILVATLIFVVIKRIRKRIKNIAQTHNINEFDLFDLELVGFGWFEPLDKIEIQTGDKIYNSFIFNNEM